MDFRCSGGKICFEKLPALPLSAVAKEGSPAPRAGSPPPSVALSHPVTFQTCGGPCLHSRLVWPDQKSRRKRVGVRFLSARRPFWPPWPLPGPVGDSATLPAGGCTPWWPEPRFPAAVSPLFCFEAVTAHADVVTCPFCMPLLTSVFLGRRF